MICLLENYGAHVGTMARVLHGLGRQHGVFYKERAERFLKVLCSGCDRNLKSRTHCNMCGSWFHKCCGNVKAQVADSRKCICDKC